MAILSLRKIHIYFIVNKDFDRIQYIIGLTLIEGVGPVLAKRMIAFCGGPKEVFNQTANKLIQVPGVGDFVARMVGKSKLVLERAEKEINFCLKHDIKPISYLEEEYPNRLLQCEDGPAYLFYRGNAALNTTRMLGIVGTRNPSEYGKEFTQTFVQELSGLGITIVSGMAYGIDITAHKTSLENQIPTLGVVAHGMDDIYPKQHASTAKKMLENGGILTEFLSGTGPDKENFPKRNRIVAGMCDATVVIETDIKGGSMITARLANDYNREVFALPGKPTDEKSKGCNWLIKTNRAALFESAQDLISIMGWENNSKKSSSKQISLFETLTDEEQKITSVLQSKGKIMIDVLSLELKQPVSEISVLLLNLEFKGLVRSLPGKMYEFIG